MIEQGTITVKVLHFQITITIKVLHYQITVTQSATNDGANDRERRPDYDAAPSTRQTEAKPRTPPPLGAWRKGINRKLPDHTLTEKRNQLNGQAIEAHTWYGRHAWKKKPKKDAPAAYRKRYLHGTGDNSRRGNSFD